MQPSRPQQPRSAPGPPTPQPQSRGGSAPGPSGPSAPAGQSRPPQGGGPAAPNPAAAPQSTSGQTALENAAINLKLLRMHGVKEMTEIINQAGGKESRNKVMVFDSSLAGPIGQVVEMSLLRELGVDTLYYLAPGPMVTQAKHVIYIVRPEVKWMRVIAEHIKGHKAQAGERKSYYIYFVPRRRMMCERVLEEEGVWGQDVKIGEYHLDLIPFDNDYLSMELRSEFRDNTIEGDKTSLFYVAKALMKLQSLFGIIPNIQGKGHSSQFVCEMLFRMRREMANEEPLIIPEIDRLILIDRECDLVTPCISQLTYEGMVDEVFGIYNSTVDLPADMVIDPKANEGKPLPDKKIKTVLNSNDAIHLKLRDLNFSAVGPCLNQQAQIINDTYAARHQAKSVAEIRVFMESLASIRQSHQALRVHTNIAEKVIAVTRDPAFRKRLEAEQNMLAGVDYEAALEYIQEAINKQESVVKVFRLLCLYSLTNNGLKEKEYNFIRREILQTYGYRYMFALERFAKLGMFKQTTTRGNPWERMRQYLRLIIEELNEAEPDDIAYVYSGYAPVSCRLIEHALRVPIPFSKTEQGFFGRGDGQESDIIKGWGAGVDANVNLCPGPAFHATQTLPKGLSVDEKPSKVTLVFFVGGICFTEMSACRFMTKKDPNNSIIVATTKLTNGNNLIESMFELLGEKEEFATGDQAASGQ